MLEIVKISGADTEGRYGLLEVTVRAGEGSPWHVHPDEDEWFYVLDGEFTVYLGDTRLSLTAGSFAFGPRGVPHTRRNTRRRRSTLPDMAQIIPIGKRNGIEILGPPARPGHRERALSAI